MKKKGTQNWYIIGFHLIIFSFLLFVSCSNGLIDEEDDSTKTTYYKDADGDGYGDPNITKLAKSPPEGYVENDEDPDDSNELVYPGSIGNADILVSQTWFIDADGDGYGNPDKSIEEIFQPAGYTDDNTDPDDSEKTIYPGSPEICHDGIDNDQNGDTDENCKFTNDLNMEFSLITAGTFEMGSPSSEPGKQSDEIQHQVTLTTSFYMQTTEVTQGQWKSIMEENPSSFSSCGDDCPVENVSWEDVKVFIEKLNETGTGYYRLPTEAEWEYAARSGSESAFANGEITSTTGTDYYLDMIGWYRENTVGAICEVAGKQANAWGLYDMHGNVQEWCSDWYRPYPEIDVTDPIGGSNGYDRVVRGGYWNSPPARCRSAERHHIPPDTKSPSTGFRLVKEIDFDS